MNNTTTAVIIHIPSLRVLIAMICVALYIFGYTGCFLSIVTFSSKKLRSHSTGFLFLIMAFVDIFNLFASLQYFLEVIYHINVFTLSIHWCRFFTICNYELYFGFSWIFAFISLDRWMKVEWPTKSQTLCTRTRFLYLCLIGLLLSLIQNVVYAFLCLNDKCRQKTLTCEIFIHVVYISLYMVIPIVIILLSISRTCLITLHIKKRFRSSNQSNAFAKNLCIASQNNRHSTFESTITSAIQTSRTSSSYVGSSAPNGEYCKLNPTQCRPLTRMTTIRRRRAGLDTQMIILISINVAPFILVHIITEIAYLFESYSSFVAGSPVAQLFIILIYLSWYLISATRFYTNCLLSRIYREEFLSRIAMLRNRCKPPIVLVGQGRSPRHSTRTQIRRIVNGVENTLIPTMDMKSITMT
ncbi:unnamed protein product [Adineta ricciae]|uniref:G-protein coupled receptors family 1 profile domain-containing protein n=1 Tax=Adineta ricciae TaxID=249248 RepID=A0A813RKI5_ADIRI|nr:unnamed protein product [Adineta ricciae]CAF1061170.1 unnamed protein product [Adineta ricciae]